MKKGIILSLCLILFITGCGCQKKNKSTKNQIEIKDGYNTYAYRKNDVLDGGNKYYTEEIVRYDQKGNFKYFEITENVIIDDDQEVLGKKTGDMTDRELEMMICSSPAGIGKYKELTRICEVKNHIYKEGYSITDKTIKSGLLDDEVNIFDLKNIIEKYDNIKTEESAKNYFESYKNKLKNDDDILIIKNEKIK